MGPSSERHQTTTNGENTSNSNFVSAVSSLLTSVRSIRGGPQQSQEECCSICLEPYKEGDTVATSKPSCGSSCKHKFHKDCLLEWLQHPDECPLCRVDMICNHDNAEDESQWSDVFMHQMDLQRIFFSY